EVLNIIVIPISTLNKNSEPIGSNDISAQLDITQALRVICKRIGVLNLELKKKVVARLARENRAQLSSEVSRAGDRSQQLRVIAKNSHNTYRRQSILGQDLTQTRFKRASKILLDKVLVSGNIAFVRLARQVILERAYIVGVANEDSWAIVFKIVLADISDPMLELLGEKLQLYMQQPGFGQQVLNQLMFYKISLEILYLFHLSQARLAPSFYKIVDNNYNTLAQMLVIEPSQETSYGGKLLEEHDLTFLDDIEMVKEMGPFVFKEFNMLGGQSEPKTLLFYREEVLFKKGVESGSAPEISLYVYEHQDAKVVGLCCGGDMVSVQDIAFWLESGPLSIFKVAHLTREALLKIREKVIEKDLAGCGWV
ncbi:25693_t:CDS:10, partial [Racocetra persica]